MASEERPWPLPCRVLCYMLCHDPPVLALFLFVLFFFDLVQVVFGLFQLRLRSPMQSDLAESIGAARFDRRARV